MPERKETLESLKAELELLSVEHRLLQQHNAILLRLALAQQQPELSFEQTIQQFTNEVGDFLTAQRVSVWIYNHDKSCMRCLDIYDAQESSHTSGQELEVEKFPQFIAALEEERFIAAADAASDARTAEFVNSTRTPYSISSMLASPIRVQRAVRGVMYCEQLGTGRKWTDEQQHFLASVTDLLSVSIATHDFWSSRRTPGKTTRWILSKTVLRRTVERDVNKTTQINEPRVVPPCVTISGQSWVAPLMASPPPRYISRPHRAQPDFGSSSTRKTTRYD